MTVIYQCLNAHYIFMNVFKEKREIETVGEWGGEAGRRNDEREYTKWDEEAVKQSDIAEKNEDSNRMRKTAIS